MKFFKLVFLVLNLAILSGERVNAADYLCQPWTSTLTRDRGVETFTVVLDGAVISFRGGGSTMDNIPKFSQLSVSLPSYDLFISPNGTMITAAPESSSSIRLSVFFPWDDIMWFLISKCRMI